MAGKNYGTMNMGYYYDEGKKVGFNFTVGSLYFSNVAYHSKTFLTDQLVNDGYKKEDIEIQRIEND